LLAHTIRRPSRLNIGKPSNVSFVVTCSTPPVPSALTRNRSKLPLRGCR
jgi:hypothetical protein